VGFEVEFKSTLASPGSDESIHPCEFCLSIEPKFKAELSGELSFLNLDWLSADITVGVFILPVGNMYWSKDNNEFGFGICPYATYKTVINVYDADKNPVAGEKVSISGQDAGMTNQDGTVVFYLPAGKHFATVTTDASTYAKEIVVDGSAQKVAIYLNEKLNSSGEGNVIQNTDSKDEYADQMYGTVTNSGTCGENAVWKLYDSGVLVISGKGKMFDYYILSTDRAPWHKYRSNIKRIIIGEEITSIGNYAFYECSNLTGISIPKGIKSIGAASFYYCTSLLDITIPETVTTIETNLFYYCLSLTSITLPEHITSIGVYAFGNCSSLNSITIPSKVINIGMSAFSSCTNLQTITIPKSVTFIGDYAFRWCKNLSTVYYEGTEFEWDSLDIGDLNDELLNANIIFVNYAVPEGLEYEISGGEVTITNYIGNATELEIPAEIEGYPVTDIGNSAFYDCTSLTNIIIPEGVTTIEYDAFRDCTALEIIILPNSITSIESYAFYNTAFYNDPDNWHDGMLYYDTVLLQADINVSDPNIIKDGTTMIAGGAFSWCLDLTSIHIPNSVTMVGESAFYNCSALTKIEIPDSVLRIERWAFRYCSGLLDISMSKNIEYIGLEAFEGTAYYEKAENWQDNVLYIDNALISSRESIAGEYAIKSGTTIIAYNAFFGCSKLTKVIIPQGTQHIGDCAFCFCNNLSSISIPDSISSIGPMAFFICTNLSTITFSGNAPLIGEKAFGSITATAYYPEGNPTWTEDVMQDYGGNITWVPYTSLEDVTLYTVPVNKAYSTYSASSVEDYPVSPMSVYPGDYGTEEGSDIKTASFEGLVPGGEYVLLVLRDMSAEDTLSADNLLYIAQGTALEDGTLSFRYVPKEDVDISYIIACGASDKNLNDAVITFPEMEAGSEARAIEPVVEYDGQILTEGVDYIILGDVDYSEGGTYTCYIRGIYDYTGVVTCTYTVTSVFTLGDINNDGDINGKDSNMMKQLLAGAIIPTETQLSAADVNKNGTANGVDSNLLKQYLAGAIKNFD